MKPLRAVLLSIFLWVLIFVEISIIKVGLNLIGITQQIIHYILLIPMTLLCAWIYYKSGDMINGFVLGAFFLLVGNVLDLVITVPLFIKEGYAGFYSDPFLWVGFLVVIAISGIYDIARKK